ncbi:MAG: PKD domain-containing protein [Vicinamibacterales bacterium]
MAGPSELTPSVTVTATPDVLPQDGSSSAVISIVVRDAASQPIPNMSIRVTTNIGRLSTGQVTTGSDGRATLVFTAPLTTTPGFDPGTIASISVTPIGNNFDNAITRTVSIRLVQPAVIQVPGAPFAAFTFGPPNPRVGDVVQFDASASFDANGTIVSYEWDWNDGDLHGFGKFQDHDFRGPGTYFVMLTVTDDSGLKSSAVRGVTVVE